MNLGGKSRGRLVALAVATGACSSTAEDDMAGVPVTAGFGGDEGDESEGNDHAFGDSGRGEDDGGGTTGAGDPGPDPAGGDEAGAAENEPGCPDPLPEGWIFCEDFEALGHPTDVFYEYADADGAFTIVDGTAASGKHSMQATYQAGLEGAGLLLVSFGDSPIDHGVRPAYAPGERFDEIYWRVKVRMEPDWPSLGPGRLTRAMAFAAEDWSEAFVAHVRSNGDGTTLEAVPQTCIAEADVECAGYDDQAGLESIGGLYGTTEIFAKEAAGDWHCVEVHMKVNTLGQA